MSGEELLVRGEQEEALARLTSARGSTQPVDVLLFARREINLDDEGDVGVVQTAGGDVG